MFRDERNPAIKTGEFPATDTSTITADGAREQQSFITADSQASAPIQPIGDAPIGFQANSGINIRSVTADQASGAAANPGRGGIDQAATRAASPTQIITQESINPIR